MRLRSRLCNAAAGTICLLLAGCSSSYHADLSTDHWTFNPANDTRDQATAVILAPSKEDAGPLGDNGALSVTCFVTDKQLGLMVHTAARPSGSGSDRRLRMAFDEGTPHEQTWFDSGQEFALFDDSPQLLTVIRLFRSHRQVEFVASDHTGEIWRATFTLNGADAAIGRAFQACGK